MQPTEQKPHSSAKKIAIIGVVGLITLTLFIAFLPVRINSQNQEVRRTLKSIVKLRETVKCDWLKDGQGCYNLAIHYATMDSLFPRHAQACDYGGIEYSCYSYDRHLLSYTDPQVQSAAFGRLKDRCEADVFGKRWDSCVAVVNSYLNGTGVAQNTDQAIDLAQNECGINSDGSLMRDKSEWLNCGLLLTVLESAGEIGKDPARARAISETAVTELLQGGHRDNQNYPTMTLFAAIGILWPQDAADLERFEDLIGSSCADLGQMDVVIRKPTRLDRFDACRIQRDMNDSYFLAKLPRQDLRGDPDPKAWEIAMGVIEDLYYYKPAPPILLPLMQ